MTYPKRSQYKYTKKAYRIRNWRAHEEGLCGRGDVTIWLSEDALRARAIVPLGRRRRCAIISPQARPRQTGQQP